MADCRQGADYVKGSHASLVPSSVGESISEYGVMDESVFNEDGSFIGLYKTDRDRKLARANGQTPTEQS